MADFKGSSGTIYRLSSTPFAGGGEGDIYDIDGSPGYVAKIYKPDRRTTERERKLLVMSKKQPDTIEQYSWPIDILYENGSFAGFVMGRISDKKKLSHIYSFGARQGISWKLYIGIAKNLAAAVYSVHKINQVIGDLNPENIMADPVSGLVVLVDTDSYHISDGKYTYRCAVAKPEYVPKELQGVHFSSAPLPTFTKETDCFALAVLIFALLMNGNHPFSCKVSGGSASSFQPYDNIKNCCCAFFEDSRRVNMQIPVSAPGMDSLPVNIRNLFHKAFIKGHSEPSQRPAAEEWFRALEQLECSLKHCSIDAGHLYYRGSAYCPWCSVQQRLNAAAKAVDAISNKTVASGAPPTFTSIFKPITAATTATANVSGTQQTTYYPPVKKSIFRRIAQVIGNLIGAVIYYISELWEWVLSSLLIIGIIAVIFLVVRGIYRINFKRSDEGAKTAQTVMTEQITVNEQVEEELPIENTEPEQEKLTVENTEPEQEEIPVSNEIAETEAETEKNHESESEAIVSDDSEKNTNTGKKNKLQEEFEEWMANYVSTIDSGIEVECKTAN